MQSVSSLTFTRAASGIKLKSEAWLMLLAPKFYPPEQIYDPENQRDRYAQHDACDDRK